MFAVEVAADPPMKSAAVNEILRGKTLAAGKMIAVFTMPVETDTGYFCLRLTGVQELSKMIHTCFETMPYTASFLARKGYM